MKGKVKKQGAPPYVEMLFLSSFCVQETSAYETHTVLSIDYINT